MRPKAIDSELAEKIRTELAPRQGLRHRVGQLPKAPQKSDEVKFAEFAVCDKPDTALFSPFAERNQDQPSAY